MRRHFTRITALLLVLIVALSLCACGNKEQSTDKPGNSAENGETPAYIYHADFQPLLSDSKQSFSPHVFTANGFYAVTYELVEKEEGEEAGELAKTDETETADTAATKTAAAVTEDAVTEDAYEEYRSKLYYIDFSGSFSELVAYEPAKAPEREDRDTLRDYQTSSDLMGIALSSDGKLVVVESVYEVWFDGPEGMTEEDEEYWDYRESNGMYYLRTLDQDGRELSSVKLDVKEDESFNAYSMVLDSQDRLAVPTDRGVQILDLDGNTVMTISAGEENNPDSYFYVDSLIRLKDGRLAATTWGEEGEELWIVDEEKKAFGEKIKLPRGAYNIKTGGGDYDAYYTSGINFYGLDFETGESTKLFNWLNCDINSDYVDRFSVRDDGSVITVISEYDRTEESFDISLATISLVPYDSVPHRETITLATQGLGYDVRQMIIDFNRKNEQCRIEVADYSEFNTEEDYSAGLTKLTTELLAGNMPDIIDLNGMPYDQLAGKGLLEDLYPYLDADEELSREDFFPNVLQALEVEGGLYQACGGFSLSTVIGAASVVGDEPGWTYEEFDEALASMPEGCEPFDIYTTRDTILQMCLYLDMDDYVNWATGECKFDSESFTKLLAFAARFPESFDWENYEYTQDDSIENRIAQGRQMLMTGSIYSIEDIFYNTIYFGGDVTYIGFPTADGHSGNLLQPRNGYAMSAKSEHKDAVWQFLRQMLTEKGQSETYGIPTNLDAYEKKIKEAMTPEYQKDEKGNYVLDDEGNRIKIARMGMGLANGQVAEFYELSQEQADQLWDVLTSTTAVYSYGDKSILDIVAEQAQAYFEGQKTAEEVARLVQSKANIYVNEQR